MRSQTTLLLFDGIYEEDDEMGDWSDETKEIMQIIRDRPDLTFQILALALEAAERAASLEAEIR